MKIVVPIGLATAVILVATYLILATAEGPQLDPPGRVGPDVEPPRAAGGPVAPPAAKPKAPDRPGGESRLATEPIPVDREPASSEPISGSAPAPAPESGVRAVGCVKDVSTGLAVGGATVEVRGRGRTSRLEMVTGADGRYEIVGLLPRHRSIVARADGYDPRSFPLRVLTDEHEVVVRDFDLRPKAVVSGQVLGPDGEPVAGVEIDSVILGFTPRFRRVPLAVTDREGRYRAVISAGPYRAKRPLRLFGKKAGFAPGKTEPIKIQPGEIIEDVIIRMDRGGGVEGRVLRDGGRPFKSAHVNLVPNTPPSSIHLPAVGQSRVKTDVDGRYRFIDVPAGAYRVTVWFGRLRETRQDVHVVKGQATRSIDFTLETGRSIAGIVVDGKGRPLRMAAIRAKERTVGVGKGQQRATLTDDDGAFQVFKLTGGLYDLTVSHRGYRDETVSAIPPGAETLRVALSKLFAVTGRVFLADGVTPCPAFTLQVFSTYQKKTISGKTKQVSDAEGKFTLGSGAFTGQPPFSIRALNDDGMLTPRVDVRLESGFEPEPLRLVLATGAVIRGVVSSEDGRPVAGAWVQIRGGSIRPRRISSTSAGGRFEFAALPPGSYVVAVTHPDWVGAFREVRVQGNEQTRLALTLMAEGGAVHVTVLDEQGAPIGNAYVTLSTADRGVMFDLGKYRKLFQKQSKANPGRRWRDYYQSILRTDASGRLVRRFLPAGTYRFAVHAAGYRSGAQSVHLPAGGQVAAQIVLKKAPARTSTGSGRAEEKAKAKANASRQRK